MKLSLLDSAAVIKGSMLSSNPKMGEDDVEISPEYVFGYYVEKSAEINSDGTEIKLLPARNPVHVFANGHKLRVVYKPNK